MNRASILGLGVLVSLTLTSGNSRAQGTSAAGISGTVKDTSGAVLPGVTVEASSPALIEKVRTTVTDDQGQYQITELRPGTYVVTFTLTGFSTFKREGLELPSSFTATLNPELQVGSVEETVTVSGETPLVDVQNVTAQKSIPKAVLDAVPTGKGIYAFVSLMPAAIAPTTNQDVGGSLGDTTMRITVHGSKGDDAKLAMDGLSYNITNANGTAREFFVNPLSAQEVVIDTGSGGSAEWPVGGAVVNLISRDGGNMFSGTVFAAGSVGALQAENLTEQLRAQGLTSSDRNLRIYDLNAVIGGPIVRDRLWFVSAHRRHGQQHRVANLYGDANWAARTIGAPAAVWKYAPDYSKPVEPTEDNQAHNFRVNWQASAKDKINASYDWEWNRNQNNIRQLNSGGVAWEANAVGGQYRCGVEHLSQVTWTRTATNRLLFEGGWNFIHHEGGVFPHACIVNPDRVYIRDVGTNFIYNGVGIVGSTDSQGPTNQRFSASYVTGAHTFKVGVLAMETARDYLNGTDRGGLPYQYTFNNGVPTGLTIWVSPLLQAAAQKLSLGLFGQDQWRIGRLTLNLGLRYEYANAYAPELQREAGPLQDAASFPEVTCLPCWHDLYPRVGVAYNLFGDGKTVVKGSIGRYGAALTTGWAEQFRPVTAAVNSTTRSWTDLNANFFPDCDLRNPLLNGECGPDANQSFGQVQIRNSPAPGFMTGWGKRGYNWQTSLSVDRELRPGIAASVGYYRTWFGNFTVTDNLLVTPADFDPYCITAPIDSRLPSDVSGQQICGLYDIKPEKFGQVDNIIALAKHYGKMTEEYNGVDASVNVRLRGGALLSGGWNVGNSISLFAGGGGSVSDKISRCFVVDTPQQLFNCESGNEYQHRFKLNGTLPLPWGLQAAAVFQSLPGPLYGGSAAGVGGTTSATGVGGGTATGYGGGAVLTVTTAEIAPSLGRNLAGNTRTVSIDILPPFKYSLDTRVSQLDFRLSKVFSAGTTRIQGNFDLYNALNASTVLNVRQQLDAAWLQPTQIMAARLVKFGVQLDF
jgi:Carboxypeptidase regulatory-like domain